MNGIRACWLLCAALGTGGAAAQIADVRQGTNIALALSPGQDSLVVDLLGGLWQMPASGGGATALVPAGDGVRNPRFHPDGRSIVAQRWSDGQWDLWTYALDTGEWRALTNTAYNEREPEFSADGRSVLFAADSTGQYCLWALDLADGALRRLTDEPGDSSFPAVSDSGDLVYVNHDRGAATLRLYTGRTTGTEVYRTAKRLGAPSWRPGGRVIVFSEISDAPASTLRMLVLADEPVLKDLTRAEDVFVGRAAWRSAAELIYAADGQIWRRGIGEVARTPLHLFAGLGGGSGGGSLVERPLDAPGPHRVIGIVGAQTARGNTTFAALGDLWLADRRGVEQLTNDAFLDTYPSLSPDGESLVFVSDRGGNMDLWLLTLPNRVIAQLTGDAAKPFEPVVAPDGRHIAYLETDGLGPWAEASLKVMNLSRPYTAATVATGLYDARNLRWDARPGEVGLRVEARRSGSPGTPLDLTFTYAGAGAATAAGDVVPLATVESLELEWVPETSEPYVVEVGRVFDGIRNEYQRHMDIHVAGQKITAIVRRGALPSPARIVDARDATVIPGLIDVHAHHSAVSGERLGRMWLVNGVTTVREIGSTMPEALERAESWASGRRPGPRLVISPIAADSPDRFQGIGAPLVVDAYADVSPGFAHVIQWQREQLGFPTRPAGPAIPVGADAGAAVAPRWLEVSPRNVIYQDSVATLLASRATISTGLAALSGSWPGAAGGRDRQAVAAVAALYSPSERDAWRPSPADAAPAIAPLQNTIGQIVRSGARVAIGSDAPAVPYGFGLHAELARLAEAGIPNDQVLRLASAGGATALGLNQQLGTLEAGKLADFVVLSGDPLARIADASTVVAVVKAGKWFTREQLLARPTP